MKGLLRIGIVLVTLTLLLLAGRSSSEPAKAPPAAAPRSRIVLVNLNYVVKNYRKFIAFQGEMKEVLEQYQKRDKELAGEIETLTGQLRIVTDARERAQAEKKLKTLESDREKNKEQGKEELQKKSDKGMVELYNDVRRASTQYARAQNIDAVMHFNDAIDPIELDSPPNIARKLQAGACIPLYTAPGVDVSEDIVALLNDKLRTL